MTLDSQLERLEAITIRLEKLYGLEPNSSLESTIASIRKVLDTSVDSKSLDTIIQKLERIQSPREGNDGSLVKFDEIISNVLSPFLTLSAEIGDLVETQGKMVQEALEAQRSFLLMASTSKKPSDSSMVPLLKGTSDKISQIQAFREKNRRSEFFNHLSAVSESIPALGWVTVNPAPGPFVKEMNDAGQFYTNRVLKDFKDKAPVHGKWVKAWIAFLSELQDFIKKYHTTGLVWNPKGVEAKICVSNLPPPPPPVGLFDDLDIKKTEKSGRSDLLASLNMGENVTKGLKKVTSEMQTHKNPSLRSGSLVKTVSSNSSTSYVSKEPVTKAPKFELEGKKWFIEFQRNNHDLIIMDPLVNHSVYLYKCENSSVKILGKINNVILDSCKKTAIVFDSVVSSCEFINCASIQMQVTGKVPTINVEKTDGCQMYLSKDSLDTVIISSKSSEMNVSIPKGDDFIEYPISEQFKTVFNGTKLITCETESC